MKPKYEKPKVIDLEVPKAWGGNVAPMGVCYDGSGVGSAGTEESCNTGWEPTLDGQCLPGWGASTDNICDNGSFV